MVKLLGVIVGSVALVALGFFTRMSFEIGKPDAGRAGFPPSGGPPTSGFRHSGGGGDSLPTSRPSDDVVAVEVAAATLTTIRERVVGNGVLEPEREVTVVARVEGEIEAIHVEEGDSAISATSLCVINRKPLEIAHALAEAQRDRDRAENERMLELRARNVASDSELDAARYAYKISAATVEQAELDLTFSQPKSPFDAIVVKRFVEKGQNVRPGDSLFAVADFDPLLVRLYLPEEEVRRISVGQRAELRPGRELPAIARGQVDRVSPVVDRNSLTVEVVVSFATVPAAVRPGSFVHVDIITRIHENVILVPRAAVLRRNDAPHLFRVHEDRNGDRAIRVEVTTGYEDEAVVEIREGLQAEELVVVEGHQELREHDRVTIYRRVPVRGESRSVPSQEN